MVRAAPNTQTGLRELIHTLRLYLFFHFLKSQEKLLEASAMGHGEQELSLLLEGSPTTGQVFCVYLTAKSPAAQADVMFYALILGLVLCFRFKNA